MNDHDPLYEDLAAAIKELTADMADEDIPRHLRHIVRYCRHHDWETEA